MSRRTTTAKASNASKIFIAKDPVKDFDKKMKELIQLMLRYGFKDRMKERDEERGVVRDGLIFYDLTLMGEMANVIVSRNENGFGSKSPLKIYIYLPIYDDNCGNWEDYYLAVSKINKFIEDVKEIDGLFLQ